MTALLLFAGCNYPELSREEIEQLRKKQQEQQQEQRRIAFSDYTVYSDNNGDKIINKGETVGLRVTLKNVGTITAYNVGAYFSTTSSYVTFTTASVSYGDISAGNTSTPYDIIRFTVSNTAPAGTQIPIDISITDNIGNTWTDSFTVTVQATGAQMAYGTYTVYTDDNNDKIINQGERVGLRVTLKNVGTSKANGVMATFSTASSYVSNFSPTTPVSYGDISAGGSYTVIYSDYIIRFTVSNAAPADTEIPINISMTDESGNTWTDSFSVTVQVTNAQIAYGTYYVYSDNNGDKIINKGETVGLQINLKNEGTSAVNGVMAAFSTTSPYVSNFTPSTYINYGNISGGGSYTATANTGYTIRFIVSNTAPAGTQIPIDINIKDGSGNTWTDSFTVTVQATGAQMAYHSYSVYSDNNSDGIITKGETVGLRVTLKNVGTSRANGVMATFSTAGTYASNFTPTTSISCGNISAGGSYIATTSSGYTIRFTVSNAATAGTQIPIDIYMEDETGNTWTDSFNVVVGNDAADLAYSSYTVVADNNSNKIIERGETAYLQVYLRNFGSGTASAVRATFSTSNEYLSGLSPTTPITYGNFTGGQSRYGYGGYDFGASYTIKFTVANYAPVNTPLPIDISITDGNSRSWTSGFTIMAQGSGGGSTVSVTGVSLNLTSATTTVGGTLTLTPTVEPTNATNKAVTWSSSDPAGATVNNGVVTAVAPGSATITVTTADGSYTAVCVVIVQSATLPSLTLGGVTWAAYNVDDYQTFAARPDMYTKFYQWNQPTAWAATGTVSNWSSTANTSTSWTINPCPSGWRLPTLSEFNALRNAGSTGANANSRGNAVAGRFYGPNHATCTMSALSGCVFFPVSGYRSEYGNLSWQDSQFALWSTQNDRYNGDVFTGGTVSDIIFGSIGKAAGLNIRCVKNAN